MVAKIIIKVKIMIIMIIVYKKKGGDVKNNYNIRLKYLKM